MRLKLLLLFQLLFCIGQLSFAQESNYKTARDLAFAGDYKMAMDLCMRHLDNYPNDNDYKTLLGRIHAWIGEYAEARAQVQEVIRSDSSNMDALQLQIDIEYWNKSNSKALEYCDKVLENNPEHVQTLLKKAKILSADQPEHAEPVLQDVLALEPENEEALKLNMRVHKDLIHSEFSLKHAWTEVETPNFSRHITSLEYLNRMEWGSIVASLSLGDIVGENDGFWESDLSKEYKIDLYPKLTDYSYLYLGYAYAEPVVFPKHRIGAEYYHIFNSAIETSLGYRFLDFESLSVDVYTLSLSYYYSQYYFTLRAYLSEEEGDLNQTYLFKTKYFFDGTKHFLELGIGAGVVPDETVVSNLLTKTITSYNRRSYQLFASYRNQIFDTDYFYKFLFNLEYQKYHASDYSYISIVGAQLGYRF